MKSKVFSIDIVRKPNYQQIWIYRTNGTDHGGGLRFYNLTTSRLIRLLRAMVNVSTHERCVVYDGGPVPEWTRLGVVEEMYAAEAAIERAS